jgi:hypothetical protein
METLPWGSVSFYTQSGFFLAGIYSGYFFAKGTFLGRLRKKHARRCFLSTAGFVLVIQFILSDFPQQDYGRKFYFVFWRVQNCFLIVQRCTKSKGKGISNIFFSGTRPVNR